jgi:alanyl aminopeptidase
MPIKTVKLSAFGRNSRMRTTIAALIIGMFLVAGCDDRPASAPKTSTTSPAVETASGIAAEEIPLGRLPRHVQPRHYRLELTILPEMTHFSGSTEIDLDILKRVDHFYLHGRFLVPGQVTLVVAGETLAANYEQVDPSGVVRISLPRPVQGEATLKIDYTAPFNESLEALYRVEAGGRYYAFTQFEAISAREAFPGWDEPAFKVPFDVSLIVHTDQVAIANTPEVRVSKEEGGLKRVDFATSKPLPAYLVAFAVGDLDVVEGEALPPTQVRERAIPLRGIAVAGRGPELQFALENTRGILEALETYFDTPYPYAKLDLIAVPDFGAGAMENAGAITYRDSILLVDAHARPQTKRRLYEVHAHELAHQWFGDLVTPEWWDDIWLNESFATWMASASLDIWRPEGRFRRDLANAARRVMDMDSLISARQIRQPVTSNHGIANAFDGITYSKGGAVLSMFESYLGRDAFRAGVQAYLRSHAWSTATSDDFISALASQSETEEPETIATAFRSFLEQPGLPMLDTKLICEPGETPRASLEQSRYLPLGSQGSSQESWHMPVCLKYGKGDQVNTQCLILGETRSEVELATTGCPDYLMPNADGLGYYRWNLDRSGWQELLAATDRLSVEEMMSVTASLDGSFNAGAIDVGTYLQVAQRLSNNPNYLVATAPIAQLDFIYQYVADESQRAALAREYADIYSSALDRAGLEEPGNNDEAEMQAAITDFVAIRARLPELREALKDMAWQYVGFPGQPGIHPDGLNDNLLGTALAIAVQEDSPDAAFAQHLEAVLKSSDNAVFRSRALDALGYATQVDYRTRLLTLTLSPELRDNEFYLPLFRQLDEENTREAAWTWTRDNLDAVLERLPEWSKGSVAYMGRQFCDAKHRAEVENFFKPLVADLQGGPRTLASTLEAIDLCIAKAGHHRPGLRQHLAQP